MAIPVDDLEIRIEAESSNAAAAIGRLVQTFQQLKTQLRGGAGLTTATKQLRALSDVAGQINRAGGENIRNLAVGLRELATLREVKISAALPKQIAALNQAVAGIEWTSGDKVALLAEGLRPLSELGRANLTSFINQLKKLPEVIEQLDGADLDRFAKQMERVSAAIGPLAWQMNSVASGFSRFPSQIGSVVQANARLEKSNIRAGRSFSLLDIGRMAAIVHGVGTAIGKAITASNEYVENLNLFTVSMGEYAEAAKEYAEEVRDVMGIDPSAWMRNQGIFMTLATGFGVAADRAAVMSENLTQLGYDLSSFFNISVEDSMQKLQSGISGKPKTCPLTGKPVLKKSLNSVKSKPPMAA